MITINDVLKYDYKRISFEKKDTNTYDIEQYVKGEDKPCYVFKDQKNIREWDLIFNLIRLFDEQSFNQSQLKHLILQIDEFAEEKYNKGFDEGCPY